jgi:hypothetical protein
VVANKTITQVDQVSELNALARVIVKVKELEAKVTGITDYAKITGGPLMSSDLALLGLDISSLTNITDSTKTSRLNAIYRDIIDVSSPANVNSILELQAIINSHALL